jgi:uncharacterized membrane protein YwaF
LIGLAVTSIALALFAPKIRDSKYEAWFRYGLIAFVLLFEWRVFESRMLNASIFRLPLCAVSLYGLTYAVAFKKPLVFKITYFYIFGAFLTYLFYDTLWGLDRWDGWKFFGAHATIVWLAVYGWRVLGYKPNLNNLYQSMVALAIYAFISGYATYVYGGDDNLFLQTPPVDFLQFLVDIHQVLYVIVFCMLAALLMYAMYIPVWVSKRNT